MSCAEEMANQRNAVDQPPTQPTDPVPGTSLSFWSRLRFKIIAPYLVLALLLAVAGTFFLARIFAERLEEQLQNELWQAGHYATDEIVYIERELLTSLRAIARTQGVADSLIQGNLPKLYELVAPLAVNASLDLVEIVTPDGQGMLSLHRIPDETNPNYTDTQGLGSYDWALVQRVAAGEVDDIGDKFAGLVHAPWGWCFYIGGPIQLNGQTVGIVLVGTPMSSMVQRMAGHMALGPERAADAAGRREVTVYDAEGKIIATTFVASTSAVPISPNFYRQVQAKQDFSYLGRSLQNQGTDLEEAFGSFDARHGADLAVFSVSAPGHQREQLLTQVLMALVFSLAVIAVVLVGLLISAQIVRPVLSLVRAAGRVERGDLAHKVLISTEDEIGLLAHGFNRMIQGLRTKEYIRDAFGRFVSREVSESLLRGEIRLQGEKRIVSMLFADIRDFTRLSEQYDPDVMVRILNDYFSAMVEVAQEHGGTVNKFGGDSTLVIYGAPIHHADHANRAVESALWMRRRLAQLNTERLTRGEVPIRMGIGINTGEVVAGTVGSSDRMEYTVIGDAVNLSARVQGLNKEYPEYDILISEYTLQALHEQERYAIRSLGAMTLKGKSEAVRIYAVVSRAENDDGQGTGT
jgi:class 3 adenylate cyclase